MKKIKFSTWRTLTILFFLVLAIVGLAFHTGTGTLCALGYKTISAICPLGSLETMLADKILIPSVLISLVVFLLITFLLGRIFCAWACPVPLFRRWFPRTKKRKEAIRKEKIAQAKLIDEQIFIEKNSRLENGEKTTLSSEKRVDPSYYILGGALGSSFIFGFPVFCLICPVGLTFALIVGVWRLIGFNEPTWSLLIIPAFLIVELIYFRYSCHKFCPLGALFSIVSRFNKTYKPTIDENKCLHTKDKDGCNICHSVCEENINLHHLTAEKSSRCTKCHECMDSCPMHAISFKWLQKK